MCVYVSTESTWEGLFSWRSTGWGLQTYRATLTDFSRRNILQRKDYGVDSYSPVIDADGRPSFLRYARTPGKGCDRVQMNQTVREVPLQRPSRFASKRSLRDRSLVEDFAGRTVHAHYDTVTGYTIDTFSQMLVRKIPSMESTRIPGPCECG